LVLSRASFDKTDPNVSQLQTLRRLAEILPTSFTSWDGGSMTGPTKSSDSKKEGKRKGTNYVRISHNYLHCFFWHGCCTITIAIMKRSTRVLLCLALSLTLGSQAHAILRPRYPMKPTLPYAGSESVRLPVTASPAPTAQR